MELRMFCAYNQTRECFLGLEVTAGDFSYEALSREGALTIKANEGLWLCPFRGIPELAIATPMDLIYLDKDCRVVHLVEAFPAGCLSSSAQPTETVLVLPAHSIFLSETRLGDQLVLRAAEEMPRWLECHASEVPNSNIASGKRVSMVESLRRKAVELLGLDDESDTGAPHEFALSENGALPRESPRKWYQRLFMRDLRQSARKRLNGLAAYYWNGLPPSPHEIRDISSSGLYVLTEDRWYPGTVILMTLQDKDSTESSADQAIPVRVRAVRWGQDGVGLQFVVENNSASTRDAYVIGSGRAELDNFLERLGT